MTRLSVLSPKEKNLFCSPPKLKKSDRPVYFALTKDICNVLRNIANPTNKVGFVLQLGYFKASASFFTFDQFRPSDIRYIKKHLNLTVDLNLSSYTSTVNTRHRRRILKQLGWLSFGNDSVHQIIEHIQILSRQQTSPTQIFRSIVDFCWKHKIEVPSYNTLANLITDSLNEFEETLLHTLEAALTVQTKQDLNELFDNPTGEHGFRPPLTLLRKLEQSLRPADIQRNITSSRTIAAYYHQFESIIDQLALTDQAAGYFARWVVKANTFQLRQFPNTHKAYLYLLAYLRDQHFRRQDVMAETFLKCVRSTLNQTQQILFKSNKKDKEKLQAAIKALRQNNVNYKYFLDQMADIVKSKPISEHEKIQKLDQIVDDYLALLSEKDQIKEAHHHHCLEHIVTEKAYYDILEEKSRSLQNRVSGILKFLEIDEDSSDRLMLEAIQHFKKTDGHIGKAPPLSFLDDKEKRLFDENDAFRTSLYKILLFFHVADRIKSGKLNLKYSYRYRAIHDYFINKRIWEEQKQELIKAAGLSEFADVVHCLAELKDKLHAKYKQVNHRFQSGDNEHMSLGKDSRIHIRTPKTEYKQDGFVGDLLIDNGYVHVLDVLREANALCDFTSCFKHFSNKHSKMKPKLETIMAGLMGMGCNIGVRKIANISTGISENTLANTVNWFFDLKNIYAANRRLTSTISKLALANVYKDSTETLHTSSDGRKVTVGVESIHAAYSFKYYGKDKGMSMYGFLDERQALFHSMVISPAEREAAFVIDGLLQNEVEEQVIHSTDTHGYTETLFAATHFIGVSFAPRIKNIGKQNIYGFSARSTFKKQGYDILPSRSINQKLIVKHWDDILRFMATISLKHTSASQLFKRLNSYTKDHSLYKALKEFGRIIKSHFILAYFDDVEFRQRVEKQLSRIELSNKFDRAVFFDNNQEFQEASKEGQEIATACKTLIQNAIVLWNYLFLSQRLTKCDGDERADLITSIKTGSIISWRHINLKGEYNFTRSAANDSQFDVEKIMTLNLANY